MAEPFVDLLDSCGVAGVVQVLDLDLQVRECFVEQGASFWRDGSYSGASGYGGLCADLCARHVGRQVDCDGVPDVVQPDPWHPGLMAEDREPV